MKKFFAAILALVMAMSLVACGSNGGNAGDNTASDSSVTLTAIVAGLTEDSPSGQALKKFAELTNQYSNGSVTIDCFFNTELGNVAACVEGATQGTIDIVSTGTSYFAGFVPAIQVFELPYIFNSYDEAHKTLDNEPGKAVADMFEGSGLKMLCYWESGMRHVTNSRGPIVEPSDMKGLKIRTQDRPTSIAMIRAMGGSATPMSSGETYTGLQQGIIDGAENNETVLVQDGHGEVCKSYTYTQHQMVPDIVIISTETWESLDEAEQSAIVNGMTQGNEAHEAVWQDLVQENIDGAKEMGVQFYTIDKTAFIEATQSLRDEFCAKSADNARYYEDFLSYVQA